MGHRSLSEKVTRSELRPNRPILLPSKPVSEGIEFQQGCQFICSLFRALGKLIGGLGRFIPCTVGGHMSRLRHLGWHQCSHGLTSRPLESCVFGHYVGCLGILRVQRRSFWMAPYSSATALSLFPNVFPHGTFSGSHGLGGGRVILLLLLLPTGGNSGKNASVRVRLTRKSRPVVGAQDTGHDGRDPGLPTPKRWKRLLHPVSSGTGGEVGAPQHLFPRLGVG